MNVKQVFDQMKKVDGWFAENEGELLMASCIEALKGTFSKNIVEIGSFKGRSTIVLGSVAKDTGATVWAIDPHEGVLTGPQGLHTVPPTFEVFLKNITDAGLKEVVTPIKEKASDVKWEKPIAFLFIDGLHDYQSVLSDFQNFHTRVEKGGLLAFHDYSDQYPGVKRVINQAIASGVFEKKAQSGSLAILKFSSKRT